MWPRRHRPKALATQCWVASAALATKEAGAGAVDGSSCDSGPSRCTHPRPLASDSGRRLIFLFEFE